MATTTMASAISFLKEDDDNKKECVSKDDMSKKYNEDMNAFIKKQFALVHNPQAHPCKSICRNGDECPLIGLPNDTCAYYVRDKCDRGNCKRTHYDEYAKMYRAAKQNFQESCESQKKKFEEDVELDKQWLDTETRVCPVCVIPVEKLKGCPSMSCPKCRTLFNWEQMKPATGAKNNRRFKEAVKRCRQPLPDALPSDSIVLFISTMAGKTLTLTVPLSEKVENLMKKISERLDIPTDIQRLQYAGKQLKADILIKEYDMQNNSTIHLVFRLPGGTANHFDVT